MSTFCVRYLKILSSYENKFIFKDLSRNFVLLVFSKFFRQTLEWVALNLLKKGEIMSGKFFRTPP